jgi:hypothetical protein
MIFNILEDNGFILENKDNTDSLSLNTQIQNMKSYSIPANNQENDNNQVNIHIEGDLNLIFNGDENNKDNKNLIINIFHNNQPIEIQVTSTTTYESNSTTNDSNSTTNDSNTTAQQ